MLVHRGSAWFKNAHGVDNGVKLYGTYVDVSWQHGSQNWSVSLGKQTFVKWAAEGCPVSCRKCHGQNFVTGNVDCPHVQFVGEGSKVSEMVNAIRMGLL